MSQAAIQRKPEPALQLIRNTSAVLTTPFMDWLMIGGASVGLWFAMNIMFNQDQPGPQVSWWIYNLSFIANFPHFLVSYQILYVDFGKEIFRNKRFFWAAVLAPLILATGLIASLAFATNNTLGYFANAMYFFVGWHYSKQIFGGMVVSNTMSKYFYNQWERWILKANLFSLWAISYVAQNLGERPYAMNGVPYQSLNFPQWTLSAAQWAVALSAIVMVGMHTLKYVREGQWPHRMAIACCAAFYVWYLPACYHPHFFLLIPFFHSMQYLLFVYTFRRNKVQAHNDLSTAQGRKAVLQGVHGYLIMAAISGGFFMFALPRWIDQVGVYSPTVFGAEVAMFVFTVFINIHHYFIDNVIWRGNNPEMKKYLFS